MSNQWWFIETDGVDEKLIGVHFIKSMYVYKNVSV